MGSSLRRALFAVLCVLQASCFSPRVAPISGSNFQPDSDERPLWSSAEKIHLYLERNGLLLEDPAAQAFIEEVADRLRTPFGLGENAVRLYIVRDPFLNAFALPDGRIYLHTGILGRLTNRDQLAALLGHEMTHFTRRHSLREQRSEKNRLRVYQTAAALVALAAAGFAGNPSIAEMILQLAGDYANDIVQAQVAGFSRDLEREADRGGFDAMVAAGYDPHQSAELFRLLQETEDEAVKEPFFFGSHPLLQERIDNAEEFIHALNPATQQNAVDDRFQSVVADIRLLNADLDLKLGRIQHAKQSIDRHLEFSPESAPGLFALGEFHRRHDTGFGSAARAGEAYRAAISYDPEFAAAHRELGLLARTDGDCAEADSHLRRYVELSPMARDRQIVESFIGDCEPSPVGGA